MHDKSEIKGRELAKELRIAMDMPANGAVAQTRLFE